MYKAKILFIGNSHTYFNDMPYIFKELCNAKGHNAEVTMLTRGGESLSQHAKSEQVAFNLRYGNYDFVVLQEVESEFPNEEDYKNNIKAMLQLIKNSAAIPIIYENFSPLGKEKRQEMIADICEKIGNEFKIKVAKVGRAFAAVQKENPQISLYYTDNAHACVNGSYLAALTIAKAIFDIDTNGLPYVIMHKGEIVAEIQEKTAQILKNAVDNI